MGAGAVSVLHTRPGRGSSCHERHRVRRVRRARTAESRFGSCTETGFIPVSIRSVSRDEPIRAPFKPSNVREPARTQTRTDTRIAQSRAQAAAARHTDSDRKLRLDPSGVGFPRRDRAAEGQLNARNNVRWVSNAPDRHRFRRRFSTVVRSTWNVVRSATRP